MMLLVPSSHLKGLDLSVGAFFATDRSGRSVRRCSHHAQLYQSARILPDKCSIRTCFNAWIKASNAIRLRASHSAQAPAQACAPAPAALPWFGLSRRSRFAAPSDSQPRAAHTPRLRPGPRWYHFR